MSAAASHQLNAIDLAIEQLVDVAAGSGCTTAPTGYPHLGLAIVDAVFCGAECGDRSTRRALLQRYADAVPGFDWSRRYCLDVPWHGASALLGFLRSTPADERFGILGWQTTVEGGFRRADLVLRIANLFLSYGVDDVVDFARGIGISEHLERDVLAIGGVDEEMWHRLLTCSGGNLVKPDSCVVAWVRTILFDDSVSAAASACLIETATGNLQARGALFTLRQVEHLIRKDASELRES